MIRVGDNSIITPDVVAVTALFRRSTERFLMTGTWHRVDVERSATGKRHNIRRAAESWGADGLDRTHKASNNKARLGY